MPLNVIKLRLRRMPDLYHLLKLAHIIGAAILFGTGIGIAFFMLMAHRSRDAAVIAHTARVVVIADMLFTADGGGDPAVDRDRPCACCRLFAAGELDRCLGRALHLSSVCSGCRCSWFQKRMRDLAMEAVRTKQAAAARAMIVCFVPGSCSAGRPSRR